MVQQDEGTACCHERKGNVILKSKLASVLMFLVFDFAVALIVNIVAGRIFHDEQFINWITALIITIGLTILNLRQIRRTADTIEKDGLRAGRKAMFSVEKK